MAVAIGWVPTVASKGCQQETKPLGGPRKGRETSHGTSPLDPEDVWSEETTKKTLVDFFPILRDSATHEVQGMAGNWEALSLSLPSPPISAAKDFSTPAQHALSLAEVTTVQHPSVTTVQLPSFVHLLII
ncbi:hypothetical protein Taro_022871 [Colocasia esculenta]|uniref:Uncharacterized protein n=1 Tax=Colocasia esculenta TaxID=4460 RepID=A0A843VFP9_COLES|nr:hypothetical protein [Colocasia esculenta]